MSFDEVITWAVIFGLGFVAWKFKVQPELERRKREGQTSSNVERRTNLKNITPIDAIFKEQGTETNGKQEERR